MEHYKMRGKIDVIFDLQNVSEKFRKREFVLETTVPTNTGVYINHVKFQTVQQGTDILETVKKGDKVVVEWSVMGRRWKKDNKYSYFTNLEAKGIIVVSKVDGTGAEDTIEDQFPMGEAGEELFAKSDQTNDFIPDGPEEPDDLPF